MKTYDVILTRDATESVTVRVEAENESEAEEKGREKDGMGGWNITGWELDEGNCHDVYTTGVDEVQP